MFECISRRVSDNYRRLREQLMRKEEELQEKKARSDPRPLPIVKQLVPCPICMLRQTIQEIILAIKDRALGRSRRKCILKILEANSSSSRNSKKLLFQRQGSSSNSKQLLYQRQGNNNSSSSSTTIAGFSTAAWTTCWTWTSATLPSNSCNNSRSSPTRRRSTQQQRPLSPLGPPQLVAARDTHIRRMLAVCIPLGCQLAPPHCRIIINLTILTHVSS